ESSRLQKRLGPADKLKLGEYLESVRDLERHIQGTEAQSATSLVLPERPVDIPESFDEHRKLMFELVRLAYQADLTRVFSLMIGVEGSGRAYPQVGVSDQHHSTSHHRNDPELIEKKAKIDAYHVTLFSDFLQRLHATKEGDETLLDHAAILYGGG